MRLYVLSDLHLEQEPFEPADVDADVIVLAGDIDRGIRGVAWAARWAEPHDGPTVIVTHHAPLIRGRPPSPTLRAVAGAFASDVTDLMGAERVALWIFGHTHRLADLELRGTHVVSNPRGYPHQPVAGFDPAYVVDLS